MSRDFESEKEPTVPLLKAIDALCSLTEFRLDSARHVKQAFLLGLWHESFPEYMLGAVEASQAWSYPKLIPSDIWESPFNNLQRFQFISNTGDSWHQCYQDLRSKGWKRLKVHREGGRLQYLLHHHRLSMPEGYTDLHLVLDISIATCKQVKVGTRMVEEPIFETQCEDLVELPDGFIKDIKEGETITNYKLPVAEEPSGIYGSVAAEPPTAEVTPLVVINDLDAVEMPEGQIPTKAEWEEDPFCDHGKLSGNCSQSDCPHFSDSIPF